MNPDDDVAEQASAGTTRRKVLRMLGLGGLAVAGIPILDACSSKSSTSKLSTSSSSGSEAATTAAPSSSTGDAGKRLAELLKIDAKTSGGGTVFKMGAVLAFTGPGAYYGQTMSKGIKMAVKHIKDAGGPDIQVSYYDHKSGDAQAGVDAMRQIGSANVPAKLASYVDDLGAMLPLTVQYKCFTLDGGGGTSLFGQGKPYFWGTRAITPNDAIPGLLKYIKAANPSVKKLGFIGWDLGEPINGLIKKDILSKFSAGGFQFNGLYELYPVGSSDYSTLIPKIAANEPDALIAYGSGQDPGHFASQYDVSSIKAPFYGFEFTPDGLNASKGAYDKYGFTFSADYFDENVGVSPLAKLFIQEFKAANGSFPDFYAANFYENTLVMWECIRRVIAKGGNVNSGDDLDKALQDNLTVVSVYGGDSNTVGSYVLDPSTHSVKRRNMGVFTYKSGKVKAQALFNIDGADFKMA